MPANMPGEVLRRVGGLAIAGNHAGAMAPRLPATSSASRPARALSRWFQWTATRAFGDVIIVLFLLCQVLDGALTYVGVITFGRSVEANPLLNWLMGAVGEGTALTSAKVLAGTCGIALHLTSVHRIVALLTLVYLGVAVIPWTGLLFF